MRHFGRHLVALIQEKPKRRTAAARLNQLAWGAIQCERKKDRRPSRSTRNSCASGIPPGTGTWTRRASPTEATRTFGGSVPRARTTSGGRLEIIASGGQGARAARAGRCVPITAWRRWLPRWPPSGIPPRIAQLRHGTLWLEVQKKFGGSVRKEWTMNGKPPVINGARAPNVLAAPAKKFRLPIVWSRCIPSCCLNGIRARTGTARRRRWWLEVQRSIGGNAPGARIMNGRRARSSG